MLRCQYLLERKIDLWLMRQMLCADSLKSNIMDDAKTFYVPGDIVTLRHDKIENM